MFNLFKKNKVKNTFSDKVIIIGAGISGLIAGIKLIKAGIEVTIIEKEPQVGGRVYSEMVGDTAANLGAQFFFKCDNEYLNYYVKKAKKFMPLGGVHGALWDGTFVGDLHGDFMKKLPITKEALKDLERANKKMQKDYKELARDREYIFDKHPNVDIWDKLDSISAKDYLSEFHPDVTNLYNCFLIPEGGVDASETSALLLVGWFGPSKGDPYSHLIEGGNNQLAELIAEDIKQLGGKIILSTAIENIVQTKEEVTVYCEEGNVFKANYAIVTTPAPITKKIVSDLPASKLESLDAVTYGKAMEVGLKLTNFYPNQKVASSIFYNENIHAHMSQTKKIKDGEASISINVTGEDVQLLDDQAIIDYVGQSLNKIQPEFDAKKHIKNYAIKKWHNGIVVYPVGMLTKYQDELRREVGRIYFAGDYTHNPALDGAAWSGTRSAEQIIKNSL